MNEYRDIKDKILHAFRDLDYKYTPGTLLTLSDMLNKLEKEIRDSTRSDLEKNNIIISDNTISTMKRIKDNDWLFIYRFNPDKVIEESPEELSQRIFKTFYQMIIFYLEDKVLRGEKNG